MLNEEIKKCGHNIKFDVLWLIRKLGCPVNNVDFDTYIAEFIINAGGSESMSLGSLIWKYLPEMGGYKSELGELPHTAEMSKLIPYCAKDVIATHKIWETQKKVIESEEESIAKAIHTLYVPASVVLANIEAKGIKIDTRRLDQVEQLVRKGMDHILDSINEEPSVKRFVKDMGKININSHSQLSKLLFEYEGLKPVKFTPSGAPSTDIDTLSKYSPVNNLCRLLKEYSLHNSMKKTFIKETREFLTNDCRLHPQFNLVGIRSGRVSSSSPNLQNIPKGEKDIYGIRKIFIADDGYYLVNMDYSQHELRCLAELSKDEKLINALRGDVHTLTASEIFNIPINEVTEEQRRVAKTINFGVVYGMSSYGLMERLNLPREAAEEILNRFYEKYPGILSYRKAIEKFLRKNGYVYTLTGLRRYFSLSNLTEANIREAVNTPIQGLAAHILLYGMIGCFEVLKRRKSFMVLQVHDSILFNIHRSELKIIDDLKSQMLNYFKKFLDFSQGLKVDVSIGENWGEMVG